MNFPPDFVRLSPGIAGLPTRRGRESGKGSRIAPAMVLYFAMSACGGLLLISKLRKWEGAGPTPPDRGATP